MTFAYPIFSSVLQVYFPIHQYQANMSQNLILTFSLDGRLVLASESRNYSTLCDGHRLTHVRAHPAWHNCERGMYEDRNALISSSYVIFYN
jgi:hypothetical protein